MHVIDSVEASGIRGRSEPINIIFHRSVNFLIGRNGSGKTTLINLINSALAGDISALTDIQFKHIRIKLKARRSNKRPIVEVSKHTGSTDKTPYIKYSIRQYATAVPVEFLAPLANESDRRYQLRYALGRLNSRPEQVSGVHEAIRNALSGLLNTTWLSVHRSSASGSFPADEQYDFPIDKRLSQVALDFGAYFSTLDK